MKIAEVTCTNVLVPITAPLLHSDGVTREIIRTIIQIRTDDGLIGLGEVGPRVTAERLAAARLKLLGEDPFALERLRLMLCKSRFHNREANMLFAGIEMACLDIQAKTCGRPLYDLLGGPVRSSIPMIAYIFRLKETAKSHAVSTPDEVVEHTKTLVRQHGFKTLKWKAGSASWREDVEVAEALREAFPAHALRVDPNGIWSLETSLRAADSLRPLDLEWLEDPVIGLEGMAEVTRRSGIPTATNMCLTDFYELPQAIRLRAVDVVLLDIWFLGGLTSAKSFAQACDAWKVGVGIHSGGAGSAELGIGIAAMLHLATALPYLVHAADSSYHHCLDDVIKGSPFRYEDGSMTPPKGPGLGVELDIEKVAQGVEAFRRLQTANAFAQATSEDIPVFPSW